MPNDALNRHRPGHSVLGPPPAFGRVVRSKKAGGLSLQARQRLLTRPNFVGFPTIFAEVGIRDRHSSTRFNQPIIQVVSQTSNPVRVGSGNVGLLTLVCGDVVQLVSTVFVVMNQLPVAVTDDRTGLAALVSVVRIMPEQWTAGDLLFALQQRTQAHAINVLFRSGLLPRQFQQSRVKVGSGYGDIAG